MVRWLTPRSVGELRRNLVSLGERNCTLTLQNCVKDVCYATRDVTSLLPQDQIERPLPSRCKPPVRMPFPSIQYRAI
jgi:hypothetical protein